jgi:hypothetical protein
MRTVTIRLMILVCCAAFAVTAAHAQPYRQDARAAVQSPALLGMGDAGVALAGTQSVFFYNPAHLARLGIVGARVSVLGLRADASTDLFDEISFATGDLQRAIDRGLDNLSAAEREDLYEKALTLGRQPTVVRANVSLPAVLASVDLPGAPALGVGGGAFVQNTTRYQFTDGGGGIPDMNLYSQMDLIVPVSAAMSLPIPGSDLAAGITGKFIRRYVGYKDKSLDAFSDDENVYVISGNSVSFDLGVHYSSPFPGLDFGLAVYDIVGGGFSYSLNETINLTGDGAVKQGEVDEMIDTFSARDVTPSFRIGAAYRIPLMPGLGMIEDASVALDYVSASTSDYDQPFLAKLRLGAQASLAGILALRAGINQGYPSIGAGLNAGIFKLDYVYYGVEDGRQPGDLQRYNHLLQLRFGF